MNQKLGRFGWIAKVTWDYNSTVALFCDLYVLDDLCTKTKVLLKSLMDDLLSLLSTDAPDCK